MHFMQKITPVRPYPKAESGLCVVAGSGGTLFDDLERFRQIADESYDLISCNHVANFLPGCRHMITCHPDWCLPLLRPDVRSRLTTHAYLNVGSHISDADAESDFIWRGEAMVAVGTVLMAAVAVMTLIGYDRIVLCGGGLSYDGYIDGYTRGHPTHEFDKPMREVSVGADRRAMWKRVAEAGMLNRVRSMSGWTRDLLGAPLGGHQLRIAAHA